MGEVSRYPGIRVIRKVRELADVMNSTKLPLGRPSRPLVEIGIEKRNGRGNISSVRALLSDPTSDAGTR